METPVPYLCCNMHRPRETTHTPRLSRVGLEQKYGWCLNSEPLIILLLLQGRALHPELQLPPVWNGEINSLSARGSGGWEGRTWYLESGALGLSSTVTHTL